jgi:hypothetical protein
MTDSLGSTISTGTVARIRELNESIIAAAEAAGTDSLATYEQMLAEVADFQKSVASSNPLGLVTTLASSQAKFVERISSAFTTAARSTLT